MTLNIISHIHKAAVHHMTLNIISHIQKAAVMMNKSQKFSSSK